MFVLCINGNMYYYADDWNNAWMYSIRSAYEFSFPMTSYSLLGEENGNFV